MAKEGAQGGSERPAEPRPRAPAVLQATRGDERILLHGSALDPREALVASLLEQIQGTAQEVPLTRLLVSAPIDPLSVPSAETLAVLTAATRSAAALGQLSPVETVGVVTAEGDVRERAPDGPSQVPAASGRAPEGPIPSPAATPGDDPPPAERVSGWQLGLATALWGAKEIFLRRRRRRPSLPPSPPRKALPPPEAPTPSDPLAAIDALDRRGKRLDAMALARAKAVSDPDPLLKEKLAEIASRIIRAPAIDLEWEGKPLRVVFGTTAVLGRAGADIHVPHPGITRRHLEIGREAEGAFVRDLGSLNGTFRAGECLSGAVAVGDGLTLTLAETVPCHVFPEGDHALAVDVGGGRAILVFEGPLRLGGLRLERRGEGADRSFVLTAAEAATAAEAPDPSSPAIMRLFGEPVSWIDLCRGDAVSDGEGVRLRVV
jgi:hypothetical protein